MPYDCIDSDVPRRGESTENTDLPPGPGAQKLGRPLPGTGLSWGDDSVHRGVEVTAAQLSVHEHDWTVCCTQARLAVCELTLRKASKTQSERVTRTEPGG